MSRGIQAGGKQVVKYTNTSDHYRVCSFSQNEAAILVFETTQFKFRQGLRHCCCCEVIYDRLTWSQQVIKVTSTHILSVEVKHVFILFPLSKKKKQIRPRFLVLLVDFITCWTSEKPRVIAFIPSAVSACKEVY